MGLDQYLFKHSEATEIGYWRKQPWLDNYMCKLWQQRNDNTFNMQRVSLSVEDIQTIIAELQNPDSDIHPNEEDTGGFFNEDNTNWYQEQLQETIKIFQDALADKQSGQSIFYTNWW